MQIIIDKINKKDIHEIERIIVQALCENCIEVDDKIRLEDENDELVGMLIELTD